MLFRYRVKMSRPVGEEIEAEIDHSAQVTISLKQIIKHNILTALQVEVAFFNQTHLYHTLSTGAALLHWPNAVTNGP